MGFTKNAGSNFEIYSEWSDRIHAGITEQAPTKTTSTFSGRQNSNTENFILNNERMKTMKNNDYDELDDMMDGILELFNDLPQATVKILNPALYRLMLETAAKLTRLLSDSISATDVTVNINEMFNLGSVSVETDSLTVYSPPVFAELICKADNFEVYPLLNGNIRLDITFYGVLKSVM